MANETTTGTLAALIATEKLAQQAIQAHLPRMVLTGLVHRDSIDGERAPKKRYMVNSDLGAASGGTEGVDTTPTVAVNMGTSVDVTPSIGVKDMVLITEDAVMQALGVMASQVRGIFAEGSQAQFESILAPIVNRMIPRGLQKIEADGLSALLAASSTTVGSSGNDITIANLIQAQYQFRKNAALRPIGEAKYLLTENQKFEIDLEAASASGGVAGALWNTQLDYSLLRRQAGDEFERSGLIGTFLGYEVYTYDNELIVTANAGADVAGAFGVFGVPGVAPDAPQLAGKCGAWVYLERSPLSIQYQQDASLMAAEAVMSARYAWAELVDLNVVGIITDAP
jgi:hypothetical protein